MLFAIVYHDSGLSEQTSLKLIIKIVEVLLTGLAGLFLSSHKNSQQNANEIFPQTHRHGKNQTIQLHFSSYKILFHNTWISLIKLCPVKGDPIYHLHIHIVREKTMMLIIHEGVLHSDKH